MFLTSESAQVTPKIGKAVSFTLFKKQYQIKQSYLLMLGIIALASFLRFYKLELQGLWYDELHSMNGSDPDLTIQEVIDYSRTDQPPFFFLMLHFWLQLFSFTDFYGRLFSAIVGVLGIISVYFLGKEIKNSETGIISALFTAVNYFHVYYSQEVRFYSMLFLLVTLSYLFFIRSIKYVKIDDFIYYALLTTLMIYTQYYALVVVASQFFIFLLVLALYRPNKRFVFLVTLSGIAVSILSLPWMPQFLSDAELSFWIEPVTFPRFLPAYFYNYFRDAFLFYSFGLIGLYFIVQQVKEIRIKGKVPDAPILVMAFWIILGYAIPYLYSVLKAPMMVVRYTIIVLPAILIILALSITYLKRQWIPSLVIILTLMSLRTLFFVQDHYSEIEKEQWREVTKEVIKEKKSSVIILSYYAWHYNYYFKSLNSNYRVTHPSAINYEEAINKANYVWLLQGHEDNIGASREEVNIIEREFRQIKQVIFVGARGTLYERKGLL